MRYLEKEITNGRNLKENIPEFLRKLLDTYHKYSYVKLSMNYFTYYEMVREAEIKDEKILELTESYHQIINTMVENGNGVDVVARLETLRNEVISIMNILTAWVDRFNIYEYCLNRCEYRYKDKSHLPEYKDEELARDILQYLVSDKEQMVVNEKISQLVRQLPFRMTRGKFFQLLREGMKVYKDSEKGSVDDLIYMLRTVSMLEEPDGMYQFSDVITDIFKELSEADYQQLNEESFQDYSNKLQYAVNELEAAVSCYMLLAENINDAYVVALSSASYMQEKIPALQVSTQAMEEDKDYRSCCRLVQLEDQLFGDAVYEELCEEIEDGFFALEGKQEKYWEHFQKFAYMTETIREEYGDILRELEIDACVEIFAKLEKLVSGSIFVPFVEDEAKREIAGLDYIEVKSDLLEEELKNFFATNRKNVNRAVMAHILAELPVFFNNMDEVQNYVLNSLESCGDEAEKAAVTEIMLALTNE